MKLNDDLIISEKHYHTSTDVSLYKGKSILIADSLKITLKISLQKVWWTNTFLFGTYSNSF